MQFERKLIALNEATALIIPVDIVRDQGLKAGDTIIIQPEQKKHGKFVSFWKKDKSTQEEIKNEILDKSGLE